jgi:hypothetical protein
MKLFYTYTSPQHQFGEEAVKLMQIQIDNNLELGRKLSDILLYTNFDYEYRGVRAIKIPDIYTAFDPTSNKVPVLLYLLERHLLPADDLYWYHDLDVYECESFDPPAVTLFACARYAYKHDWQCGSFFFRISDELTSFMRRWNEEIEFIPTWSEYAKTRTDEKALKSLVLQGILPVEELNHRYNHVFKYADWTYDRAVKPILASHFHPEPDSMARMVRGENKHGIPFVPARLRLLLQRYGYV